MSVQPPNAKPNSRSGLAELLGTAGGAFLIWLSLAEPRLSRGPLRFTALILLGAGALLLWWGLQERVAAVWARVGGWFFQGGRRYRVHFRREALVYILMLLVLCLGALLGSSNMLMLVFGLMVGPFVLGGQVTRMVLNRLRVERVLPHHAVAGQIVAVRLQLTNRKRLLSAWMVTASDSLSTMFEEQHPSVLFMRVPPRDRRIAGYELRPARRGVYRFGPVRVACSFPLGLMERSFELGEAHELLVWPRIGRLTDAWQTRQRQGAFTSESAQARTGIYDDEFHRLREYRSGDNPRAIHWRTTARRNELMVREFQHHRWPELLIAVELWQPRHPTSKDLARVELAVSFAATLCVESARMSDDAPLRMVICGENVALLHGSGHASALEPLLEELALAQAGPAPDLSSARAAAETMDPACRRLLITTRPQQDLNGNNAPATFSTRSPTEFEVVFADPDVLEPFVAFEETAEMVTV